MSPFYSSHEFVDVTLPPGMIMRMGRGLAERRFDIPLKVKRCLWCGHVAPDARRCRGKPVRPGASLPIPQAAESMGVL